jgi:hypothetical protein
VFLYVAACFWASVGFGVVGDEYEAPVAFLFHVGQEAAQVTFEFDSPSALVDAVPYPFTGPEEGDEDVDAPVHAGGVDLALCSFTHPCWGD